MNRVILHVDLDYFFAQCEELRNKEIIGKPVAVCVYSGRTKDSGAVSTANYKARSLGIKSGIPIFRAKQFGEGKNVVFLPVDKPHYFTVSEKVMDILRPHADNFEQVSVDEAYLDITKKVNGSFDFGKEIAYSIKQEILKKEGLTCSVGVGPNKLVSKMAASHSKPDGLTLVTEREALEFLEPLEVKKLHGVGPKTTERLGEMGVKTIGDLARFNPLTLVEVFGKKFGAYLHDASNGIDDSPVKEHQREQISRIVTLKKDTDELDDIVNLIGPISKDIKASLDKEEKSYKTVSIIAVLEDMTTKTKSHTLETYVTDREMIVKTSTDLLSDFLKTSQKKLRRFGISVSGFEERSEQQDLKSFLK